MENILVENEKVNEHLRTVNQTLDDVHKNILKDIGEIEKQIHALEDELKYNEGQYRNLLMLKTQQKENPTINLTEEIAERQKAVKSLRGSATIEREIEDLKKKMPEIAKKYYETTFELPPMQLKPETTYSNGNCTIKKDQFGGRWWVYEGDTAINAKIITDENDRPIRIERSLQNSDTRGFKIQTVQPIQIDNSLPEQKPTIIQKTVKVKPKIQKETPMPFQFMCPKCYTKNFHQGPKCMRCGEPNPFYKEKVCHDTPIKEREKKKVSTSPKRFFGLI